MKTNSVFKFIISVVVCELAGVVGAIFTAPSISSGWYAGLVKPALNPPSWIFGSVWTTLYFLMGVALFLVWKNEWHVVRLLMRPNKKKPWNKWSERFWVGDLQKENIIAVFAAQLLLNAVWSPVFFGAHRPDLAFFILAALWFAIIYTIVNFYRVSRTAAWLLFPYLLWVTFAGYLNFSIWQLNASTTSIPTTEMEHAADYKNATYLIEGRAVMLVNGLSEEALTPGSASRSLTRYFGNEAFGDLDGDGKEDVAFLLTQNSGGSGTFYYVVAALKTDTEYLGTNAILLGDRIAPQTTEIQNGHVVVNYADRAPKEPMTAQPEMGVSKYLFVENRMLTEWKLFDDQIHDTAFFYPETLPTDYIHTVDWPPQVQVIHQPFSCTEGGSEIARAGKTEKLVVDGDEYCVTKETEGAAGSVYTMYAYAFPKNQKTIILTFALRRVQCANYDDPQKTACEKERLSFNTDILAHKIIQSIAVK
jgi:tryptophan-rich sensory protein